MSGVRHLFDLSDKVAFLTGAAGILGAHFAEGLAAYGASIILVDLDEAKVQASAADLKVRFGVAALGIGCDVSDKSSVSRAVEHAERSIGPISVLHNNAATKGADLGEFFAPTESYDLAKWRDIMAVNLDGMFLVAQEVGRRMANRRSGSIIQTASIYGIRAPDQRIYEGSEYLGRPINTPAVYAASKAGVVGLSNYLASLWGSANVRVNTLVPGGVSSGQNSVFNQRYSARVPLGRMARPDEMVGALIYLASDASSYVTGHTLVVDGGLSVW